MLKCSKHMHLGDPKARVNFIISLDWHSPGDYLLCFTLLAPYENRGQNHAVWCAIRCNSAEKVGCRPVSLPGEMHLTRCRTSLTSIVIVCDHCGMELPQEPLSLLRTILDMTLTWVWSLAVSVR